MERGYSVHPIPKASTYGQKNSWQTSADFRKKFMEEAYKRSSFYSFGEEEVDEIVYILETMGHVIMFKHC